MGEVGCWSKYENLTNLNFRSSYQKMIDNILNSFLISNKISSAKSCGKVCWDTCYSDPLHQYFGLLDPMLRWISKWTGKSTFDNDGESLIENASFEDYRIKRGSYAKANSCHNLLLCCWMFTQSPGKLGLINCYYLLN